MMGKSHNQVAANDAEAQTQDAYRFAYISPSAEEIMTSICLEKLLQCIANDSYNCSASLARRSNNHHVTWRFDPCSDWSLLYRYSNYIYISPIEYYSYEYSQNSF